MVYVQVVLRKQWHNDINQRKERGESMYLTIICLLLFAILMQTATEETRKKVSVLLLVSIYIIGIVIAILMTFNNITEIANELRKLQ